MAQHPPCPLLSSSPLDSIAGNLLRSLRLGRGLTLTEAADAVEILPPLTPEELQAYEEGRKSLPVSLLYDLTPVLGLTPKCWG